MCINPNVSVLPAGAKTSACKALTAKGKCSSYIGSESNHHLTPDPVHKLTGQLEIMDIEDLITYGKARQ